MSADRMKELADTQDWWYGFLEKYHYAWIRTTLLGLNEEIIDKEYKEYEG